MASSGDRRHLVNPLASNFVPDQEMHRYTQASVSNGGQPSDHVNTVATSSHGRKSVKYMTCYYWKNGGCKKKAADCLYSHHDTGMYAEQPRQVDPGGPCLAGRGLTLRTTIQDPDRLPAQPLSSGSQPLEDTNRVMSAELAMPAYTPRHLQSQDTATNIDDSLAPVEARASGRNMEQFPTSVTNGPNTATFPSPQPTRFTGRVCPHSMDPQVCFAHGRCGSNGSNLSGDTAVQNGHGNHNEFSYNGLLTNGHDHVSTMASNSGNSGISPTSSDSNIYGLNYADRPYTTSFQYNSTLPSSAPTYSSPRRLTVGADRPFRSLPSTRKVSPESNAGSPSSAEKFPSAPHSSPTTERVAHELETIPDPQETTQKLYDAYFTARRLTAQTISHRHLLRDTESLNALPQQAFQIQRMLEEVIYSLEALQDSNASTSASHSNLYQQTN